jgi:torulene dioxygenase
MKDHSFLQVAKIENLRANLMHKAKGSSKNNLSGQFTRYRLPYHSDKGKKSHVAELDFSLDVQFELPRINEAHMGKPYRYAYGMHAIKPGYFSDSIIKIDTETEKTKVWVPKKNHLPSEPTLVARPSGKSEDNGVLLTVTMDTSVKLSSMVVINAKTIKEISRARITVAIGYGFHRIFI